MLKIALLYTKRSRSEKDLGKMIDHLEKILSEMDGVEVKNINLDNTQYSSSLSSYQHLVFCGLDHLTLAGLHLALESTDPETTRITLYDEPGASAERELNSVLFRGVDHRRMPPHSVTRLTHSWSHRDIVATCKQDVLKYDNGPGLAKSTPSSGSTKSSRRSSSGSSRTRKVETPGATQTREGDGSAGDRSQDTIAKS